MFEGLNWKAAARRSAIVIGIYIALFYVLGVAFPESFPFDASILPTVVIFFFVFTVIYAFVERNKNRRMEQTKSQRPGKPERPEGEASGALRGRPNPNTSRKKTRRKR